MAIELEKNRVRYQPMVHDDGPTSDLKSSLVVLELDNQVVRGGILPCYIELDLFLRAPLNSNYIEHDQIFLSSSLDIDLMEIERGTGAEDNAPMGGGGDVGQLGGNLTFSSFQLSIFNFREF